MAEIKERLFSEFEPTTTQQWIDKITTDLKGAPFEKKLVWRTNEGFNVQPFYRLEDLKDLKTVNSLPGEFPYLRGKKKSENNWLIRQEIKVEDPAEANKKALDILNRGIDSLSFHVGRADITEAYLEALLKDICPECVELNFAGCQRHAVELAKALVAYLKKHNIVDKFASYADQDGLKRRNLLISKSHSKLEHSLISNIVDYIFDSRSANLYLLKDDECISKALQLIRDKQTFPRKPEKKAKDVTKLK